MEREEICKKYLSYGQFPLTLNTWNALSSSECVSCSVVSNSVTPQTVAHHVPLSMGFSRQEYWSGLPFPSPGYLPSPGIEPGSRALQADTLPSEPPREFQKNIYFCFIDYAKAFDCVDYNKLWKILKEMGIPDHLTCILRNLYRLV